MHGAARAQEELRLAVHRIYLRGPRTGVKEAAGFGSERLCVGGSVASAAWPRAQGCAAVWWLWLGHCGGAAFGRASMAAALERRAECMLWIGFSG